MTRYALPAARWAVMGLFLAMVAVTIAGTALFPAYLPRHLSSFTPNVSWTFEQTQAGLAQLGWQADTIGWLALARDILGIGLPSAILFLLVWRRANNWFRLYVAFVFALSAGGGAGTPSDVLAGGMPVLAWFGHVTDGLSWQFFFFLFFFFPDGRPTPRWTRWIAAAWALLMVIEGLFPLWFDGSRDGAFEKVIVIISTGFVVCAIGSQIYRFVRRSDAQQRQQTKWVVYVLAVALLYIAGVAPLSFRTPAGPNMGGQLVFALINLFAFSLVFMLVPIVMALSILRYRLWDIDVVIRRTLVYAVVTALLALVFYGSVILLQRLFTGISGQQSPVAIVASTLTIAALFSPLRRQVQDFVDRRFYRRKYDAQRVLAQFAEVARDETDLERLGEGLTGAVMDTMQPQKLGLWLKKA